MIQWFAGQSWDDDIAALLTPHCFETKWGSIPFGVILGWSHTNDRETALRQAIAVLGSSPALPFSILDFEHQAGGHSCYPFSLIGVPVTISEDTRGLLSAFCQRFFQAFGGWFTRDNPEFIGSYDAAVLAAGLTPYDHARGTIPVMEGIYPFAADAHNLRRIVAHPDTTTADLAPLLVSQDLSDHLALVIIAENSD